MKYYILSDLSQSFQYFVSFCCTLGVKLDKIRRYQYIAYHINGLLSLKSGAKVTEINLDGIKVRNTL